MYRCNPLMIFFAACAAVSASLPASAQEGKSDAFSSISSEKKTPALLSLPTLPPCPPGVVDLHWNEFFKMPVGPKGLELTDKVRSLDGKKVRLYGYMVRREEPVAGVLLLAPMPITIEEDEAGFSDLPPQGVRVILPYAKDQMIPYTPRPMLLTGVLSVGNHAEPNEKGGGNVSLFRLTLDEPTKPTDAKPASAPTADANSIPPQKP